MKLKNILIVGSLHHSLNKMTPRRAGLTKFRSPTARHPYKLPFVEFLEMPNFKVRRLRRNVAKPCISYRCNYGIKR